MQLYDMRGQRKYLTQHERERFLKAARAATTPVRAFCEVLAYSGCRLSEALALTGDNAYVRKNVDPEVDAARREARATSLGKDPPLLSIHESTTL